MKEMTIISSLAYLYSLRIKKILQTKLAKRIGMRQLQLDKIESMISVLTLEALTRYAKGLGLVATLQFKLLTSSNN